MLKILDLHFLDTPNTIAAFLLETSDGLVLFETGPHSTFAMLEKQLMGHGYGVGDIDHVFLSHIHLDHAGAAWALAEQGAKVYVHPAGYPHLKDPERLLSSAKRIYKEDMDRLWGQLKPIQKEQLVAVDDMEIWQLGDYTIKAHYTPGHAIHHIAWQINDELVAGDVGGVKISAGPVMPPCPPPDINIEDWDLSIQRILELDLKRIWLTHFGPVDNIKEHLEELVARLHRWANWMRPHYEAGEEPITIIPAFQAFVKEDLMNSGVSKEEIGKYEKANPSEMSVAGLMRYWRKKLSV